MLYVVIGLFVVIIFPIFISVDLLYEASKKIYFELKLFNFLTFLYGSVDISKTKLVIIFYNRFKKNINLNDFKKKIKPIKDFHFLKVELVVKKSVKESLLSNIVIYHILLNLLCQVQNFCKLNKPYLKLNNVINLYEDTINSVIYLRIVGVLNILLIILNLIKILLENSYNAIKE